MSFGPLETQRAIYEVLKNDATLATLLNADMTNIKIYDHVPQKMVWPFITMADMQWADRGNHTWEGYTGKLTINVWNQSDTNVGRAKILDIQAQVDSLLHKQDVCIDGWNIISFRRQTSLILVEDDNTTYHGVQIFNLLIGSI